MTTAIPTVGEQIREWRRRRRMSQLDLAVESEISSRHLSFLETGRSRPSREMVLRLADRLRVPLRDQNRMLVAAGHAPVFPERRLDDEALRTAREAVDLVLRGHEPYPALAVDRHWTMLAANRAIPPLLAGVSPTLLEPPVNVLRLSLHPDGLAKRIANLSEWREHVLGRLRRDVESSADTKLFALFGELSALSVPSSTPRDRSNPTAAAPVVPLRLRVGDRTLSLFSMTTVFGTPVDLTLSELAIESFFPADAETAGVLREICPSR
ncbi:MAG TPA: helix-turn-helix transcriptional regulator [Bauldia sp.]|nr:helix-turn-helix transcriptional regulator [Bauldia sp.]